MNKIRTHNQLQLTIHKYSVFECGTVFHWTVMTSVLFIVFVRL